MSHEPSSRRPFTPSATVQIELWFWYAMNPVCVIAKRVGPFLSRSHAGRSADSWKRKGCGRSYLLTMNSPKGQE